MTDNDHIPNLREVLKKNIREPGSKPVPPDDIPPPPKDWINHRITKTILALILIGVIAILVWKGPEWFEYLKAHPSVAVIGFFVVVAIISLIALAYWRIRTMGYLGMRYWDTERRRKNM